jgi:hypothetical protein
MQGFKKIPLLNKSQNKIESFSLQALPAKSYICG